MQQHNSRENVVLSLKFVPVFRAAHLTYFVCLNKPFEISHLANHSQNTKHVRDFLFVWTGMCWLGWLQKWLKSGPVRLVMNDTRCRAASSRRKKKCKFWAPTLSYRGKKRKMQYCLSDKHNVVWARIFSRQRLTLRNKNV